MSSADREILVMGGAGFVGGNLVAALQQAEFTVILPVESVFASVDAMVDQEAA